MFDVDTYLRRIGCAGVPRSGAGLDQLRTLHKNHLMAIPYNIAGQDFGGGAGPVHLVDLDEDEVFETGILRGGGGTCFQLNRLFHRLLRELGYDATLLAASTAEGRANFGAEVEHMFNRVALDGREWLADVGYPGPSYIEPLRVTDEVQNLYGCQYRLVGGGAASDGAADDGIVALQRRGRVSRWSVVYTFRLQARDLEEWRVFEASIRANPVDASAGDHEGGVLVARAQEEGQTVLKGRRHLVLRDGREHVRTIVDDDEHRRLVAEILGTTVSEAAAR